MPGRRRSCRAGGLTRAAPAKSGSVGSGASEILKK
jgi:hypothetical protein